MDGSAPLGDGRLAWGTDSDGPSRTRPPPRLAGAPLPRSISGDGRPPRLGPPGRRQWRRVRWQQPGHVWQRRGPVRHRDALQEDDRRGPLRRHLLEELRAVPLPGEGGLPEGRGVLLPRDPRRPGRRRAPLGIMMGLL
ncbi:hypothetical protein PVAP13_7KG016654 [Panicum virgatum]|uniref:Uncharacterized protein n=1 Tax=Panicum virgatum TaxID=38727 RepID=A0A8T0QKD3_PANVG|nr:hypothetical protein PVAP13_7KG016654 [Panicum virgatum]